MSVPTIEFRGVNKSWGKVHASRDLSFAIGRGSIHGIIGENGAGKSTAMKLLFGLERADAGEILIDGKPTRFESAADAMHAGLGMVHQHFMLAEPFTALDNLLLLDEGRFWDALPRARRRDELAATAKKYGLEVPLSRDVEHLSVGAQQKLEILKILSRDSRILILDEPTAVLTPQEILGFFDVLRRLRDEGKTILIITHKLKEIMALTDEVTVFRKGSVVGRRKTAETSLQELAELMVGSYEKPQARERKPAGGALITAKGVRTPRQSAHQPLDGLDFELRSGEILGIAGVEGNGQEALLSLLADPSRRRFEGALSDSGKDLARATNRRLRRDGWSFFPEDRLRYGVLPSRSATENYLLGHEDDKGLSRGPFLLWKKIREACLRSMKAFDVQPADPDLAISGFSGGNQQKFVVARELRGEPRVLIAAQPTRGVDLGAIRAIHCNLLETRDRGAGVLLISSELDELMELSDRLLVIERGRIVAEFAHADFTEAKIGAAMGGGH